MNDKDLKDIVNAYVMLARTGRPEVDYDGITNAIMDLIAAKTTEAGLNVLDKITDNPGGLFALDPTYGVPGDGDWDDGYFRLEADAAHIWIRDRKVELQSLLERGKQ